MKSSISFKYIVTGCFLSLTLPMEMRLGGKGRVIVPSMQRTIISKKLRPNPTNIPVPFHHIFVHQSPFLSRITLSKYVSGYRKRWQDYSDGTYKSNILTIERQLLFVLFSVKPKFLGVLNLPTSFHMSRLFFCMRGKNAEVKNHFSNYRLISFIIEILQQVHSKDQFFRLWNVYLFPNTQKYSSRNCESTQCHFKPDT